MPVSTPNSIAAIVEQYSVYRDGWEKIGYTLYHFLPYPTTGQKRFDFFQAVSGLTRANTNLELNGQLPMSKAFIVQAIEAQYISGTAPSVGGLAGGAADATINETYNILSVGSGQLTLGDKEYGTFAPLMDAPSQTRFELTGFGTDASTAAADLQSSTALLQATGRQFKLPAPVLIPNNSTFGVNVQFDDLVTVTAAGRLGIKLRGILMRKSQ